MNRKRLRSLPPVNGHAAPVTTETLGELIHAWHAAIDAMAQAQREVEEDETLATLMTFSAATVVLDEVTARLAVVTRSAMDQQRADIRRRIAGCTLTVVARGEA